MSHRQGRRRRGGRDRSPAGTLRVQRLPAGARLVDGDDVISEIRSRPGPTDSFFDILAATIAALAPGPRIALLGFAGGGLIGPLRAMGYDAPIEAVDWSRTGQSLFHELCGGWAGTVRLHHEEAARWLRRRRAPFDLILDDLAIPGAGGMTKPPVSIDELPALTHRLLGDRGVAVTNLLPVPGLSWAELTTRLAAPWPRALILTATEYENRILLAGHLDQPAAQVSRRLRAALRSIGSLQAERCAVRRLARRPV